MKKTIIIILFLLMGLSFAACDKNNSSYAEEKNNARKQCAYGVFLSETEDLERLGAYDTIVIDAQFFTKEQIDAFRRGGDKTVYTYINIGSIEDFRDYFNTYRNLTLAPYDNWDEEYWIDVSDETWQSFIIDTLMPALSEKGIDGFFVDNCDVYYHYQTPEILDGLAKIMHALVKTGKAVLINGGDTFLDAYCDSGRWSDVITGINQETVFSSILWDEDRFGTASEEDHGYFTDYIERYAELGADIYLLEYTEDKELIRQIEEYCDKNGFGFYISDSVELD